MTEEKQLRQKRFISYTSYDSPFVNLLETLQQKYPEDLLFNIQGISNNARDLNEFSKKFFTKSSSNTADLTVDANANVNIRTVSQYTAEHNKANQRLNGLYLIWKYLRKNELDRGITAEEATITANSAIELVIDGSLFINDLTSVERPYCWAQSLQMLVQDGMKFLDGNIKIGPPKRSDSFIHLTIQAMAYISNQIAGAIAFPDFFFYLDWYFRAEYGDDYMNINDKNIRKEIENKFQNFIYSTNFEFRTGQSPYTNISIMDRSFLKSLFENSVYPDFSGPNYDSIYELGKWFFEYFSSMNMKEGIFTFPVITLACGTENGKYLDEPFVDWICEVNSEKAIGNIYLGEPTSLSSCCRLKNDYTKFKEYQNSFGVGGLSIGSHRVCGINFPRLWKDSKSSKYKISHFKVLLEERLKFIHKILKAHRRIIEHHINVGVLPLYTHRWMNLDKQYSTVGIIGVYELQQYYNRFVNEKYTNDMKIEMKKDYKFTLEILGIINEFIDDWIEKDGCQYNLEQIPGESLAARLASVDKLLGKNNRYELYSNQYIPLTKNNMTISDRFNVQGEFDKGTSGGSILHINIDENNQITPKQFKILFNEALRTGTVYWALNYVYCECDNGHYFVGNNETIECPICKSKNLNYYTRVVGFITNVNSWIEGRRKEDFPNRKFYNPAKIGE